MPNTQMIHSPSRILLHHVLRAVYLAMSIAAFCLLAVNWAEAQTGGKKSGRGGASGAAPGMAPGFSGGISRPSAGGGGYMPPGMSGSGMAGPGMYGKKNADKKSGPGVRKKPGEGSVDEYDNESLPPGYQVPQEPPEAFTTDDEWIEDPGKGSAATTRMMNNDFKSIMTAGEFRKDSDKQLVIDIVKYRLAQLTQKGKNGELREKAAENRIKLEREIESSNNKPPPRAARILALKTIAEEAPRLLKYHFVARLQGAILLAHLSDFNEVEAEGVKKAAVPCTRAVEPLIDLVNDSEQLTSVRVWGINGLVRLATLDSINLQLRNRLVDLLVTQMNASGKEHEWFQLRLAEGLGKLTVIQNQDKRPVVPQALAMVLADPVRPFLVRAEAAQSLGRLQYESSPPIDVGLLAYETAKLTQQIIESYNKEKGRKQAIWKLCLIRIYGGFKPLEDEEVPKDKVPPKRGLLTQVEGKPSLAAHRKTVQEAFEVVLPLVTRVVAEPKDFDQAQAQGNLKKWLEQNTPKSLKIHPDEAPLVAKPGSGPANSAGEGGVAAGTPGNR
jgi:hypothetical protein